MRVLFWGTPQFAVPTLRALGDEGHEVVGVVTQPDRPAGRGRQTGVSPVKRFALEERCEVLQPGRPDEPEFLSRIADLQPDISVVVAYGRILKPEVLRLPRLGSVNIHASLLPELRGAAPIHWAIIRGLHTTGVTIMQMEAGLDSGPILHQVPEPIRLDESMSDLATRLSEIGAEALVETLTMFEVGAPEPVPQDHSRATHAPKLDRGAARVDWSLSALEVARWIRGLDAVPGAWTTTARGETVKLFSPRVEVHGGSPGEVLDVSPDVGVLVGTGREAVRVREVQPAGRRRMEAGEWIRGRGIQAGDRFL